MFPVSQKAKLQWEKNHVYLQVPHSDQNLMSIKWFCSLKNIDDSIVPKGS